VLRGSLSGYVAENKTGCPTSRDFREVGSRAAESGVGYSCGETRGQTGRFPRFSRKQYQKPVNVPSVPVFPVCPCIPPVFPEKLVGPSQAIKLEGAHLTTVYFGVIDKRSNVADTQRKTFRLFVPWNTAKCRWSFLRRMPVSIYLFFSFNVCARVECSSCRNEYSQVSHCLA
jgi:hypothetical protein